MAHYPVIIAGAGPSGSTASLFLSQAGISHALIDKAVFPRDKICGDALSGKVQSVLKKLHPDWIKELSHHKEFHGSRGVSFYSPGGHKLDLPFCREQEAAPGWVASRMDFDHWLFSKTPSAFVSAIQGCCITGVERVNQKWNCTVSHEHKTEVHTCDLLLGADGTQSIVAKTLLGNKINPAQYSAGLRMYWENVLDLNQEGFIELHFLPELLPGYFWIFPMSNNRCNVGLGMLSKSVSEKSIDLKKALLNILHEHPVLSSRFAHARPLENPKGWGLPLGSEKHSLSGDGFMLLGDAASLIDPFTGEGIANGMICGMHAAAVAADAIKLGRTDADFLKEYDFRVYRRLWKELNISRRLQQLLEYPWLFDAVVKKANKNTALKDAMSSMFSDLDMRSRLKKPSFYFGLFFR